MAELTTIKAVLNADVRQFNSSMSGAAKIASGLVIALGAVAAVKFASGVISSGKKFQSAISDLSAITGATGKDLKFLSDKSKEFGATTTLSASQAAEAFKLVASAKPDLLESADALAAVTKEAITLAEASGSSLPDAAKTLGSALNQFNADASESSRFINVLAAGAKFGASEIAQTAIALKQAGAVASNAGISFEETNAAIQALSTVSIKGGEAGTGLRNVLLKLQIQSNDKLNPAIVGLSTALKNLGKENLSTEAKTKLFGLENVVVADTLIKQAGNLDELTSKLTGTATAYEQARIKVDNLDGDLLSLNSRFEALQITLFGKVDPGLRQTVQSITKVVGALNAASEESADTGSALSFFGGVFEKAARGVQGASALATQGIRNLAAGAAIFVESARGNVNALENISAAQREQARATDNSIIAFGNYIKGVDTSTSANKVNAESLNELDLAFANTFKSLGSFLSTNLIDQMVENGEAIKNTTDKLFLYQQALKGFGVDQDIGTPVGVPEQATGDNDALLEQLDIRLEIIRESLLTERELFLEQQELRLEDIQAGVDSGLIIEEDGVKRKLALQKKGAAELKKIDERSNKQSEDFLSNSTKLRLRVASGFLSNIATLNEGGSRRQFKIAKAASKAIAIIEGIQAVQSAFKAGMSVGGPFAPITAAAYAASAALITAKNVSAIGSASFGGGGSISSGGGGGAVSTAPMPSEIDTEQPDQTTSVARQVRQDVTINLGSDEDELISTSAVRKLIEQINEQIDDGVAVGSIKIS